MIRLMGLIIGIMAVPVWVMGTTGKPLMLHIELMIAQNEQPYLEETATITVELAGKTQDGDAVLWKKTFPDTRVSNGQLRLRLTGADNNGEMLVTEMFDSNNLRLNVTMNQASVELALIQQPYAIKSNIADVAHNALALQGIPIEYVDEVKDGDILVLKNGKWVVMGEDDGVSLTQETSRVSELANFDDVSITNLKAGQILGFNGTQWINTTDQQLGEREVDAIVQAAGFIREVKDDVLGPGEYDKIRGFGGKIKVDPKVQLIGQTDILADVTMGGELGNMMFPVSEVLGKIWLVKGDESETTIGANDGHLHFSTPARVTEKHGVLISGLGQESRLAMYQSPDELVAVDALIWNEATQQLGLGALTEYGSIKLNVNGGARIDGDFFVKEELLAIEDYVTVEELATVARSGLYEDVLDRPDLSGFVLEADLDARLADALMNKPLVGLEIDAQIDQFNGEELLRAFEMALEAYDTAEVSRGKRDATLMGYYTLIEANDALVNTFELRNAMVNYSTTKKINEDIMQPYLRIADTSAIGKTGRYEDMVDWPNMVLSDAYAVDKAHFDGLYETKPIMMDWVEQEATRMKANILADVSVKYLTKQHLEDEGFARQDTVSVLSSLARTGLYRDVKNTPDLTPYLTQSVYRNTFQTADELDGELLNYVKRDELQPLAFSGSILDLLDPPIISDYQRMDDMANYVKVSDFTSDSLLVLRANEVQSIDFDSLVTHETVASTLQNYEKKADIAAVAFSGKFSDLMGISNIITSSSLDTQLLNYNTKQDLVEEQGRIDTTYYNQSELDDKLNKLEAEIVLQRDTALNDNYDSRVEADNKMDGEIRTHYVNEVSSAIVSAIQHVAPNETIDGALENMAEKNDLKTLVASNRDNYLAKSRLDEDKPTLATDLYLSQRLPRGSILIWDGSSIPEGWALCNGQNGTPNLSGRFIQGYGNGHAIGEVGGSNSITITQAQMPTHTHNASATNELGEHHHSGTSSNFDIETHSHTGMIDEGGIAHGHSVQMHNQNQNHTHMVKATFEQDFHTNHGNTSDMHHNHTELFATNGLGIRHQMGFGTSFTADYRFFTPLSFRGSKEIFTTLFSADHQHNINQVSLQHSHTFNISIQEQSHTHTPFMEEISLGHNHPLGTVSLDTRTHNHSISIGNDNMAHQHEITVEHMGGGQSYENRPPYYALEYIMKL